MARKWIIHGREGFSDDWGCCEPWTAGEVIRKRQARGEDLSEADIERIARNYGCWVQWVDAKDLDESKEWEG